jgi:hypothetical protein
VDHPVSVLAWMATTMLALWAAVTVLPESYWRANNVRRQLRYWRAWRRFCDHVQDHGGMAWDGWHVYAGTTTEFRQCRRCGWEQRRPVPGAWV